MLGWPGRVGVVNRSVGAAGLPDDFVLDFGAGRLPWPFTIVRASGGISRDGNGVWSEVGVNAPRFDGGYGLLVEQARTNVIRNPRGEGGAAGSPGTLPTNWLAQGNQHGITREIVGVGTTSTGMEYVDFRWHGTATANYEGWVSFDIQPTAAQGHVWTGSFFARLVAGDFDGCNPVVHVSERGSNQAVLGATAVPFAPTGDILASQRGKATHTFAAAATTQAGLNFNLNAASGQTIDVTVRIAWPQLERAGFASSPILPPRGTLAQSTRSNDRVFAPLSRLGLPASAKGAYGWRGKLHGINAPSGSQILMQIDNNGNATRFMTRNDIGPGVRMYRTNAGVNAALVLGPMMTPDVEATLVMSVRGDGVCDGSIDGRATMAHGAGATDGFAHVRLGGDAGNGEPFGGTIRQFAVWRDPIPFEDLPLFSVPGAW